MQHNAKFNLTGSLGVRLIKKPALSPDVDAEDPVDVEAEAEEAPKPVKPPKRASYVVIGTSKKRKARRIRARAKGLI